MPQSAITDCGIFLRCRMKILFKDRAVVVIEKPIGTPSQSDPSGAPDAMSLTSEALRNMGERDSLWLVHRLDRVVGGVLAFARTREAAAILSAEIAEKSAIKEYFAVVEGAPVGGVLEHLIIKDARQSKAFIVDRSRAGVKTARLEYRTIATVETERGARTLVRVRLHTGRFHQIRAQLSHVHAPIVGDGKYGSRDGLARVPALFAASLCFALRDRKYKVDALPPLESYPWSLFAPEVYSEQAVFET